MRAAMLLSLATACGGDGGGGGAGPGTDLAPAETWVGPLDDFCDMTELGRVLLPGEFKTSVAVSGTHAFVTWGGNDYVQGLEVVDISDPANPAVVAHADLGDYWPLRVRVHGDLAFVAHQWDGVYVFDISDPTRPLLRSNPRVNLDESNGYGWRTTDTAFDGRYLFIVGVHLAIYDLQDPTAPALVGELSNEDGGFDTTQNIVLMGDVAAIADLSGRVTLVDVADVTAPRALSTFDWPGSISGLVGVGDHIFATDLEFGVRSADLTDPSSPLKLDTLVTSGEPYSAAVSGDRLYVGANLSGVFGFDVSDPGAITWMSYAVVDEGTGSGGLGQLNGDGPWGLDVTDDGLVVAATKPDLRILQDCTP